MKESFFRTHIKDFKGVPSHDTFNRVFSLLNPKELAKGFRLWINEICGSYKGIKKGMKEGRREERLDMARRLRPKA